MTKETAACGTSDKLRGAAVLVLVVAGLVAVQYSQVATTNFGGSDEWLILDLSSRGVVGVPYQNRPLTYAWQLPSLLWPGELRVFWLWTVIYIAVASALTGFVVARIASHRPSLALVAGAVAASWAPLDVLRLDTVLICGYTGATAGTFLAIVVFEESWRRRSIVLLGVAAGIGALATMTVESTVPVLAVAPVLIWADRSHAPRQWRNWTVAWGAMLLLAAIRIGVPLLQGASYQTHALGLDAAPWRVAGRVLQLVGLQARPLFDLTWRELGVRPVAMAVLVFVAGGLASGLVRREPAAELSWRVSARVLAIGALLCVAAHATFALTPLRTAARTQILAGPGFALALVGSAGLLSCLLPHRLRGGVLPALGVWVVAVGTGRVVAMQGEWSTERSAFRLQRETLAGLTAVAPALSPGTLLMLIDDRGAWPTGFTFRHAVGYLYGQQVVGLAYGASDFLYPYRMSAGGVAVVPWPIIRREWGVAPSFHRWSDVVVARFRADARVEILPAWPTGTLPALPPGARYDPRARIVSLPVRERERRVLLVRPGS